MGILHVTKRRAAGGGEIKKDMKALVPVGGTGSPIPVGDMESLETGEVTEDRIIKFTDAGVERNIAGNLKDPAVKSDA